MALNKDYYKILGIPPISSAEDIRKAYRKLSKKYHPDLNPTLRTLAEDKMKELVEAYNILNDTEKRHEYDAQPQFQIKRSKKITRSGDITSDDFARKNQPREKSFIERLLATFTGKKDASDTGGGVDFKQADVHFTLGLSMAEQDNFVEQAHSEFKLAVKFDPTFAEAHYNLGLMDYKLGNFDESRISFQKVLQIQKTDPMSQKMIQLLREDIQ